MLTNFEIFIMLLIIACATLLTRALPFFIFPENKETPKFVTYLGKALPLTISGLLVVYSLKDVDIFSKQHAIPEIVAILLLSLVHLWKKNTLISIGVGTVVYMILLNIL